MKKFILLAFGLVVLSACSKKDPNQANNNTMLPDKVAEDLKSFEQTQEIVTDSGVSGAKNFLSSIEENGDSNLYVNRDFAFEFVKPSDWEQQNEQVGTLVAFLAPKSEELIFRPNINVVIQLLTQELSSMSLDEYMDMSMKEIEPYFEEMKIIKEENSQFLGVDSKLVEIEVMAQGQSLRLAQRLWFNEGSVHVITYTASLDDFDAYVDAFNIVQNTFRFRGQ